jgi:hypothetical protein
MDPDLLLVLVALLGPRLAYPGRGFRPLEVVSMDVNLYALHAR